MSCCRWIFFYGIWLSFPFFLKYSSSKLVHLLCFFVFLKNSTQSFSSQIQNLFPPHSVQFWGGVKICPLSCTVAHTTSFGECSSAQKSHKRFFPYTAKNHKALFCQSIDKKNPTSQKEKKRFETLLSTC